MTRAKKHKSGQGPGGYPKGYFRDHTADMKPQTILIQSDCYIPTTEELKHRLEMFNNWVPEWQCPNCQVNWIGHAGRGCANCGCLREG